MKKVLIVDDSAVFRKFLSEELNRYPDIEVAATASDPYVARDKLVRLDPDVITMDVEMPRMDGITFLRKVMRYYPKPVIILSAITSDNSPHALEAMEAGAVEVMLKPKDADSIDPFLQQLVRSIRQAPSIQLSNLQKTAFKKQKISDTIVESARKQSDFKKRLLIFGASTGGTEALRYIMSQMPAQSPGTLIVQHMPANFTGSFAERLNEISAMEVREAKAGDFVEQGKAFVAPGDYHLMLDKEDGKYKILLKKGPMVNQHRPSVDVLFKSVTRIAARNAISVLLTGMGKDGALGSLNLRKAGGIAIVQSQRTCVVYGMPGSAVKLGGVDYIEDLENIPERIFDVLQHHIPTGETTND